MDSFCDTELGCRQVRVLDGTLCDDGDQVTIGDVCGGGICRGVVPGCGNDSDCDDANLCTVDTCGSDLTCAYVPLPDGTACYDFHPDTVGDYCLAGACQATCLVDVDCEPGDVRDYVLSWTLPSDPDLAGFFLYLRFDSTDYGEPLDLGSVPLDPNGVPQYPLAGLDAARTYYALVTAYDEAGVEWLFMDEIPIAASACGCKGVGGNKK
jgi:hypothetical protein